MKKQLHYHLKNNLRKLRNIISIDQLTKIAKGEACGTSERRDAHKILWVKLRERSNFVGLRLDGKTILKLSSSSVFVAWTGFM